MGISRLAPFGAGKRICLTGAECTGKTTLAALLAERFGGMVVPEYSRTYAERVARELTADDVEPIARGQLTEVPGNALQILDTDLISTVVYARHHYGHCPQWIVDEARNRRSDLYLLLDIDVAWVADGIRDAGARRAQLHEEFGETLRELSANVVMISGGWDERLRKAVGAINARLQETDFRCTPQA
jgi:NadR type nicotinamide-nucleotide adenylyltransferase